MAEEEERHKGSLTPKKSLILSHAPSADSFNKKKYT
jgi:hypothetical protein